MQRNGIHHVTAIAGPSRRNLDFYTRTLGLRLLKRTVNFDDPSSYHLYFADEAHGPGTLTFFAWNGAQRGQWGLGGTHHLAFETQDRDTLRQWKRWLTDRGLPVTGPYNRVYFESIYFTDPDGLIVLNGIPVPGGIPELEQFFEREATRDPQPEIHMRPSGLALYDVVANVMAAAQRAGMVRMGFTNVADYKD